MSSDTARRQSTIILGGIALSALLLGAWWFWPASPPQLGSDKEVFDTVDALFTAVRSRDQRLLEGCQERLRAQENDGRLSTEAAHYLDGVLEMARSGQRRPAAEKLYEFMKAQRRAS